MERMIAEQEMNRMYTIYMREFIVSKIMELSDENDDVLFLSVKSDDSEEIFAISRIDDNRYRISGYTAIEGGIGTVNLYAYFKDVKANERNEIYFESCDGGICLWLDTTNIRDFDFI